MTTLSSARPSVSAQWLFWGGLAFSLVALAAGALAIGSAFTASFSAGFLALGFLLILLVLPTLFAVIYGYFRLAADRRMQFARAAYPGAYLLHVVMRPSVVKQVRAAAASLGLTAGALPGNNYYAVLVADATALRIFAGTTERVSLPTGSLARAVVQPITIGARTIDCVVLGIAGPDGAVHPIELVPVRWEGVRMRAVPAAVLLDELAAMKAATHPGL